MLEGLIEKLILEYFGDYIENLDKNNLSVGLWKGSLILEDIVIRAQKINDFKLPFRLIFGRLGKLTLNIPWKANFTVPTVISIDGVQVVLSLIKQDEWEYLDFISYEAKIVYLLKFVNERISQLTETLKNKQNDKEFGYVDRVIVKVIDNLQVDFKNINIRIEEPNKMPLYSLGITLQEMLVVNTNENWEQEFIDRNANKNINIHKLLKISNFGLYLKVNESYFISLLPKDEILRGLEDLFPPNAMFIPNMDYLIVPISLTAKMKQNNELSSFLNKTTSIGMYTNSAALSRINLYINLAKFDIEFQKSQFDCLIKILNHISNYQKFQYNYYDSRKFFYFKPKFKICDNFSPGIIKSTSIKNENAVLWLQYAIKMVIKKIHYSKGNLRVFDMPRDVYSSYMPIFGFLFKKFMIQPDLLTFEESLKLREIVQVVELQDLYIWLKPIIHDIYKEKQQENIKDKGFLTRIFGEKDKVFSSQEEERIEQILEAAVQEALSKATTSDLETKIQIDFALKEGSFKFSKAVSTQSSTIIEGFGCAYRNLLFSMRKGEFFTEFESQLKDFNVEMFTIVNKNTIQVPITFKTIQEERKKSVEKDDISFGSSDFSANDDYVWKSKFVINPSNETINSHLMLTIQTLNLIYHQVLLERVISFFQVDLNEALATKAWDTLSEIKESTQRKIKDAMMKKNVIELKIEPRKILVPICKYDIHNSKFLMLELGEISMNTIDTNEIKEKYKEKYILSISTISLSYFNSFNDIQSNKNRFSILNDISAKLGFALLAPEFNSEVFPAFKMFVDIDNITLHATDYVYSLLSYIIDIFRPCQEADLWSQISKNKKEIKENTLIFAKILKKNQLLKNWEEYMAILSSGYIYFYKSIEDEDYCGYYYIKDTVISYSKEEQFTIQLQNKYGRIEIKFTSENKLRTWIMCLNDRIYEMKQTYAEKEVDIDQSKAIANMNPREIFFGFEINLNAVAFSLYITHNTSDFHEKIFTFSINVFHLESNLRKFDSMMAMSVQGLKVYDDLCEDEQFKLIVDSEDPSNKDLKLVTLNVAISDEASLCYNGTQIDIEITLGFLKIIWTPNAVKKLFAFLAHNDILRMKILREIQLPTQKLVDENFIEPGNDELAPRLICNQSKYTYIKLTTKLTKISIVWVSPVINLMFTELRLGQSVVNLDMKVDHFVLAGQLGNVQMFDLSNYPFTVTKHEDVNYGTIKEIFGAKQNSESLITFEFFSMDQRCPYCVDNVRSKANVKINSIFLIYFQEHFMRLINYLIDDFFGAFAPSEEIKNFKSIQLMESPRKETDIDFVKLNMSFSNPQIVLMPRINFAEYFLIDLGNVTLTSSYSMVYNKIRADPNEWRWGMRLHFSIKKFSITTHDQFYICAPTDCVINLHLPVLTERDKTLSLLEFDRSCQIDLFLNSISLNLRQMDLTFVMKCFDLNLAYEDGCEGLYKKDEVIVVRESKWEELLEKYLKVLFCLFIPKISLKLYLNEKEEEAFTEFTIQETQMNFSEKLNATKEIRLSVGTLEMFHIVDFTQKEIIISDFSQLINEYSNDMITNDDFDTDYIEQHNTLSFQENPSLFSTTIYNEVMSGTPLKFNASPKIQAEMILTINQTRNESYLIRLFSTKFLIRFDTIFLIKNFFMKGLPHYESSQKDLPNNYDPTKESNPGRKINLEVKNPLICFVTDNILNKDQDVICISSEVCLTFEEEKLGKIKSYLFGNYNRLKNLLEKVSERPQKEIIENEMNNDQAIVRRVICSIIEISPFTCKMKEVLFSKKLIKSQRKIMENFSIHGEMRDIVKFIPSDNYMLSSESNIIFEQITIKSSYRDLVLYLKIFDYNHSKLLTADFARKNSSLKSRKNINIPTQHNKIPKPKRKSLSHLVKTRIKQLSLHSKGINLILIDDHSSTYYPFLWIVLNELNMTLDALGQKHTKIHSSITGKVLVYNYIGGTWEPLIEKTIITSDITKDTTDGKMEITTINICLPLNNAKPYYAFNVNISDLTICFLYSALSKWITKYFKLRDNYTEEAKKLIENDKKKNITNHTVFNYTGRPLSLYRKDKGLTEIGEILENQAIDISYFEETTDYSLIEKSLHNPHKENSILVQLKDTEIRDTAIKIDNMHTKIHCVNYDTIKKKYRINDEYSQLEYIVSRIQFNTLTKCIYFYSPLALKNKTQHTILVTLVNKPLSNLILFFQPMNIVGIPYEYLNGTIEFHVENWDVQSLSLRYFLENHSILKEIKFCEKFFITCYYNYHEKAKHKVIKLRPSFCIRNLLPFDIEIILNKTTVHKIPKCGVLYTDSISVNDKLSVSLFSIQFHSSKEVMLSNGKELNQTTEILLYDRMNNPLTVTASLVNKNTGMFVLHISGVIINHTSLNLKFFSGNNKSNVYEIAGQNENTNTNIHINILPFSKEKFLFIRYEDFESNVVSLYAIGTSTVVECQNNETVIEFVMECKLSKLSQDLDLYSMVITFSPRFIFYNQLNYPILVAFDDKKFKTYLVPPNERHPFYFYSSRNSNSMVCFRPIENIHDTESKWQWSCPVPVFANIQTTLKITGLIYPNEKRFINVTKQVEMQSTYIVLRDATIENCLFYIENFSSKISLRVWQKNVDESCEYVDIRSKKIFAWNNFTGEEFNVLFVQYYIGSLTSCPIVSESLITRYEILEDRAIALDNNSKNCSQMYPYPVTKIFTVKTSSYSGFMFKHTLDTDGNRMSLTISDVVTEISTAVIKPVEIIELNFSIKRMGISFIGDNHHLECKKNLEKYSRFEICYMTLNDIMFYSKKTTDDSITNHDLQLTIREIEIDNQISYLSPFPITFKSLNRNSTTGEIPTFFNGAVFLQKNISKDTTKILLLNYLIQAFSLSVDSSMLGGLLSLFQNISVGLNKNFIDISPVFVGEEENLKNGLCIHECYYPPSYQSVVVQVNEKSKLFIQQIEASSIELVLSFINLNKDQVFIKLLKNNYLLSTILKAISNIENVYLTLNGMQLNNFHGEWSKLLGDILHLYRQNAIIQVFKLVGAIDFLGTPVNLLNSLGSGFKDFFQKPIKGIVKGPLEGAKGMLDGSVSLVYHTVDGTFSSTSKLTSGISRGLLMLTQDEDYINAREAKEITEKPSNVVEGIGYGLSSMADGFVSGVTDIFRKPIEGARKEKWKGLGKGMLKGIGGVIAKPISGILDMLSKTSEGLKNTVAYTEKLRPQRYPRAFYGKYKFIKSYNIFHAQVIEILCNKIDQLKGSKIDFYSCEIYTNKNECNTLLVFSTVSILAIDILRKELKAVLWYSDIKEVYLESPQKIQIVFNKEIHQKRSTSMTFSKNDQNAEKLVKKIKEAVENN